MQKHRTETKKWIMRRSATSAETDLPMKIFMQGSPRGYRLRKIWIDSDIATGEWINFMKIAEIRQSDRVDGIDWQVRIVTRWRMISKWSRCNGANRVTRCRRIAYYSCRGRIIWRPMVMEMRTRHRSCHGGRSTERNRDRCAANAIHGGAASRAPVPLQDVLLQNKHA